MNPRVLLLCSTLLLTACAPTIGNKQDVRTTSFFVGETTKQEVADVLGLPADISKSEALGLEYWAYREKAKLTGIMVPVVTGPASAQMDSISTGDTGEYQFKDAAAIYVFDKSEKLIDVRYPN
ncbi:hypothetical protein GCM10011352_16330 [Marinobacterium zhoushanense]|uniref:Lipoprotein SmpA/OmlA domain-containing protein n=1 Tax=Marinobacterium zhoushanense TaxID=1679163 RepID=A0ABQ1KBP9_9GAMM|nr:hypothetical protein [Marinobacterium zhoushanense]GGB91023.1 hypothetical protein GCM10011352_16330 [Marinobacterium zhoushanense]